MFHLSRSRMLRTTAHRNYWRLPRSRVRKLFVTVMNQGFVSLTWHRTGQPVGSVKIDEAFEKLVKEKLLQASGIFPVSKIDYAARKMILTDFQLVKAEFGGDDLAALNAISIEVPGLSSNETCPAASIRFGKMVIPV